MDAIPLTNASLSSPTSDLLKLNIVPPDVARYMLQDPTLKELGRMWESDWNVLVTCVG